MGVDETNESESSPRSRRSVRVLRWRIPIPQSVLMRRVLGVVLVICGFLGFLPVLGFWMVPLGLLVLSHDSAMIRRWRRKLEVRWGRKRQKK
ncbi:hypothetical protein DUT91_07920 [Phyllobacterium salinisoli]|uniref:Uncharacterized protein n=1 Tax=Phyllobacterium salinisoli TaxID=1899321 RepID=A0A368K6G7_9HYPH|nr:hypothetical protein [Phyllobacterium salinisoli]RCS24225.1 hypothetical protein DUT91_07920 [Phyllobacterium salinisoli]